MARPKLSASGAEADRIHMKISGEELEAIQAWRFQNRVASLSEAVRRLCKMGLEADKKEHGE